MKAKLDQFESNLLYFIKGWYVHDKNDTRDKKQFLLDAFDEHLLMDGVGPEGVYYWVQQLWWKVFLVMGERQEWFFSQYESNSLPSNNWRVGGSDMWYYPEKDKFNDEDIFGREFSL